MIIRNDIAFVKTEKKYHKFGFIKNNRFYFMIDPRILNSGFSINELLEIVDYMKTEYPASEVEI